MRGHYNEVCICYKIMCMISIEEEYKSLCIQYTAQHMYIMQVCIYIISINHKSILYKYIEQQEI